MRQTKNEKKLEKHIKIEHKGVNLYSCSCNKGFTRKENYEEHLNAKHLFKNIFKCEKGCDKDFKTSSARRFHYRTVHKDHIYKCDSPGCEMIFKRSDTYNKHMKLLHGILKFLD